MASQDRKQISWKQPHEVKYILNHFYHYETWAKLPLELLKTIGKNLGTKGKMCTSRDKMYIGIKAHGYLYLRTPKK